MHVIPYVGKFWSGKILANLANGRPFTKIFPANIFLISRTEYLNKIIIITMAGLLKYFKPKQRHEDNDDEVKPKGLPDPNGDLSILVPSSSIEVTNVVVRQALEKERGPLGPYISVTPAQKYAIVQRAAENGVTATLFYTKRFPDLQLKETTVRRSKNNYLASLKTPNSDTKQLLSI